MNPTLHVRIISPQSIILDTEALSVSSKNTRGNFDILPQHANFITLVEDNPIIVRPASRSGTPKVLTFKFPISIISTIENQVDIYTYIQPSVEKK